jgi:hypothetical protein
MLNTVLSQSTNNPVVKFAEDELIRYFRKCTGIKLHTNNITDKKTHRNCITLEFDSIDCEEDSIKITADPRSASVIIRGSNPRSLLFGVYRFLKISFNICWTSPWKEGETIPEKQDYKFEKYIISETANLKYRGFYIDSAQYSVNADNIEFIIDWMAKNYGNFILVSTMFYKQIKTPLLSAIKQRGMILEVGHHGFNFFVDPNEHFAAHPEWFSELDGKREPGTFFANMIHNSQLCSTNPEVIDFYTRKFLEFWDENPEIDILGIIPNDGYGWCQCTECSKLKGNADNNPVRHQDLEGNLHSRAEGAQYHYLVNQVAHKVADKYPDRKMSFWAYAGVLQPTKWVCDLPDNMILSLAPYERWYNHPLNSKENYSEQNNVNPHIVDILREWRQIFPGEINIYEYYAKYCWQSMPKWMPELINKDISFFKDLKLQGLLSMAEYDNSVLYEINNLAHYQMSWNNSLTPEEMLDDYIDKAFSGSTAVRKLIDQVIELMKPYAKLGPRCTSEHSIKAEADFAEIGEEFKKLSEDFKNYPNASVKLEKWSKNMKMTSEHFCLNRIFYNMLEAIKTENYPLCESRLQEWRQAKEKFYSSYKSLDHSGVCVSDDVWTLNRTKTFFEYEDKFDELLEQAIAGKLEQAAENLEQQFEKLWHWLC